MTKPKTPKTKAKPAAPVKRARRAPKAATAPCVVGIGASAGGFEALRDFFKAMPADSGLIFVIIQHLDPTHQSMASDVLGKWTTMPVTEAKQGEAVNPNHVYTIPPNKYLAIKGSKLLLTTPQEQRGQRLPIDYFFDSLGKDQQARAIGIILSGTGSDGSLGLKSIELNGGIVLAQDPDSAAFSGMPLSALATGVVRYAVAVAQMPAILLEYARHPYPAGTAAPTANSKNESSALVTMLDLIRKRSNFSFSGYKHSTLLRRIHRRMNLLHTQRLADYVNLLQKQPQELDALFKDLLINVTDFYRDPEAWDVLATEVIQPLVRAKSNEEAIRVWVPACSTGEEAYSVAMLILDEVKVQKKHCPVMIFATDINDAALRIARIGSYPSGIAKHVPAKLLRHYFYDSADEHLYRVGPELRGALIFSVHNLIADPPFSQLDLITCRNVLIYLQPDIQKKILALFHFALRPGGYLFLGSAETMGGLEEYFQALSKKWRIFRLSGESKPKRLDLPLTPTDLSALHPPPMPAPAAKAAVSRLTQAAQLAQQVLLDQFAPASVLVNSHDEVLYFYGPTERYLMQPRGAPTQDLLSRVREGLRSRVRAALREATQNNMPVIVADARAKRNGGFVPVKFTVIPMPPAPGLGRQFLVVFEDQMQAENIAPPKEGESKLVRQLEEELRVTKDDLQGAIDRMEDSNEEVVSVNEELRSLNEELESSKEELQSLNEELSTVNQQLQSKVQELESTNSDLKNLLASSDIATLCLDRQLHIKWLTPGMQNIFKLLASDIGRPISAFSEALSGDGLVSDAKAVLKKLAPVEREVKLHSGRWYLRRTLPYRTADDHIGGVTITFADITESKRNAENLEQRVLERTAQLRALTVELSLAEERERRALAQDLHDDLGQVLAAAKIKLSSLSKLEHVAELKKRLADIAQLLDHAHASIRSLTFQLSPPVLFELGLVPALEWLADEMRRLYDLQVQVLDDGAKKPLDTSVSTILFRAVRELLINVAKHAKVGGAKLTIQRQGKQIVLQVMDEGIGLNQAGRAKPIRKSLESTPRGFGLLSVKERLDYIGGEMRIESVPGDGTLVTLIAPLAVGADQAVKKKPSGKK